MVRHGKPGIMLDRIFSEHKLRGSMVTVLTPAAAAATAVSLAAAAPTACSQPSGPGRRALAACVLKRACISALVPVHCRRFYRR